MRRQMMRVISSPSISTTGFVTLIFAIGDLCERLQAKRRLGRERKTTSAPDGASPGGRRYSTGAAGVKAARSQALPFSRAFALYRPQRGRMPHTDSAKRPDIEVVTAAVVDGTVAVGDVADTPVPWWSFTKTVLAAAALVLVDAGRLTLDTPLAGRRYTLRQFAQDRAGVPDYGSLAAYHDAVASGQPPWPAGELIERVYKHASGSEPGTSWTYSNVGYLFVRQLIEHAEGKEIGEALTRLVLMPLGIANAGLARTPDDLT